MAAAHSVNASQPPAREKPGHTALVTGGGLLLQQVLAFVGGVWVAHLLGPVAYGQVSLLRSILGLIVVLSPLGLDLAVFRILPGIDHNRTAQLVHFSRFRQIVRAVGVAGLAVGALLVGPVLAAGAYAGYDGFARNFALTLLALPFATDLVLLTAFYRVEGRVIPIMLITNYLQPVMRTGFNVLAVLAGLGVQGVVMGTTGAYVLTSLAAMAYRWAAPVPGGAGTVPTWRESWALFKQAPPMALNLFAYTAMRSADLLIVGAMLPAARVGEYAVVSNLSALVPVAATALSQTLGPTVARHYQAGNLAGIRDALNQYIRSATVLASFVFAGIAGFGRHIDLIFGHAYQPGQAILALIPLGYLVSATLAPTGYALTMCGKAGTELALLCVSLAVLVAGSALGAQQWGAAGAAGAVLVAFILGDAARLVAVSRSLGARIGRWLDLVPPVVGFALAAACNRLLVPAHPGFVQLVAGCVAYAALYAGVMFAARAVLRRTEAAQ